jgi:hypothetical protein
MEHEDRRLEMNDKFSESNENFSTNKALSEHEPKEECLEELAYNVEDSKALVQVDGKYAEFNSNFELDLRIEQMVEKISGVWSCKECQNTAKTKQIIKRHVEIHMEDVSHICNICNKTCKTRNSLQVHMVRNHSQFTNPRL